MSRWKWLFVSVFGCICFVPQLHCFFNWASMAVNPFSRNWMWNKVASIKIVNWQPKELIFLEICFLWYVVLCKSGADWVIRSPGSASGPVWGPFFWTQEEAWGGQSAPCINIKCSVNVNKLICNNNNKQSHCQPEGRIWGGYAGGKADWLIDEVHSFIWIHRGVTVAFACRMFSTLSAWEMNFNRVVRGILFQILGELELKKVVRQKLD